MGSESESADSQGIGLRIGFTDSSKESGRLPIPIKITLILIFRLFCLQTAATSLRFSTFSSKLWSSKNRNVIRWFHYLTSDWKPIWSYKNKNVIRWFHYLTSDWKPIFKSFLALSIRNYGIKVEHKKLCIWESESESGSESVKFWNRHRNRNRNRFVGSVVH